MSGAPINGPIPIAIATIYSVIPTDNMPVAQEIQFPIRPETLVLKQFIVQTMGFEHIEHLRVLFNGDVCDMFVDRAGKAKLLKRNETATAIYRSAELHRSPGRLPETLPWVRGPALLFHRTVWPRGRFNG